MKLERKRFGVRSEEFWFDAAGYLASRAPLISLRSFDPVPVFDCRISEATSVVSLKGPEPAWEARFSQRTRASIRNGQRAGTLGLAVSEADRREFFEAHRAFAAGAGLAPPGAAEFPLLEIFTARDAAGALLHACAFLPFPEMGLYRYRYSVAVRKSQANAALLFAAMRHAKSLGCERFDLGGIVSQAASGSKEERINFFKAQFGGETVPVNFYLRSPNSFFRLGLRGLRPVLERRGGYRWVEGLAAGRS